MQSVGNSSSPFSATSDVFVTGASSVAALDTPQLSQTKLEIRSIVAEIAELSATQLPQTEFLNAVLPRICSAMGATAAALWHVQVDCSSELVGQYRLPELLIPNLEPSEIDPSEPGDAKPEQRSHAKILQCVAAEGSPILVPPKSIRMAVERPANPLDECLLIVPIKIDDCFEMLLEVIQPSSGGPAAQRGYLRFVAQMADLMSDYLRRSRLRQFAQEASYVKALQANLLAISGTADATAKLQKAAAGLSQLLDAELVMVARQRRILGWPAGWRVCAVSNVATFDTRSEVIMAAQRWLATGSISQSASFPFSVVATDELTSDETVQHNQLSAHALNAKNLRELLGCSHLALLRLDSEGECQALIAFDQNCDLAIVRRRAVDLASTLQSLLQETSKASGRRGLLITQSGSQAIPRSRRWWLQRAILRVSAVLLVVALALFPAPDNISSVAVLESANKELYYAPSAATVDTVHVDSHKAVKKGDLLVTLVDTQLQSRLEELRAQQESLQEQLRADQLTRSAGQQSDRDEQLAIHRIDQTTINLQAVEDQLRIVKLQIDQLEIKARHDGVITTWDAQNQLRGRPVSAGQLLLSTHRPNAGWQLRLAIPERQLGRLREAMARSREGLTVQFSLSSHPSEVLRGRLIRVSDQLIKDDEGVAKAMGIVDIDGDSLPAKSDGAVARATIACGRTYAGWLAIRDAYREASAWWRLNW